MKRVKKCLGIIAGVFLFCAISVGFSACEEEQEVHTHSYTETVIAPTCTKKGYTKHICECGYGYVDTYVNKLAQHDYTTTTVTEPTCTEQGYTTYTCECGDSYVDAYVDKLGHNFVNDVCQGCLVETSKGLEFTLNSDNESYSVTGIGTCADTEIFIPSKHLDLPVTNIGVQAFRNCDSLTSVVIPDSVTSIGDFAFYECRSLTNIIVNENNEIYQSLNGNLYSKDGTILIQYARGKTETSFTIPDSVTSIGDDAVRDCYSLEEIVIPNSVMSIGDRAFYCCGYLTKISISDNVTSIGDRAFGDCYRLTEVVIPNSVTSIGDKAFYNCFRLTEIAIPDSVTSIGEYAFYNCSSLTEIAVSENNKAYKSVDGKLYSKDGTTLIQYAIGKTATTFTIPNGVTSIVEYAFYNCRSLTSVVIGESVTSIGFWAFYNCRSLTIYCESESRPSGWSSLWNYTNCPVVWNCRENDVADDGYIYVVVDGLRYGLYSDGTAKVARQRSNIVTANIAESFEYRGATYNVTGISSSAFYNCSSLTEIFISDSVTSIGYYAFYQCYRLTIYCEAESQPSGWDKGWNYSRCPVVWGYTGEE